MRVAAGLSIVGIPSSERSAALARRLGVPLASFAEHRRIVHRLSRRRARPCVVTAPHFDTELWRDYSLEAAVARAFGKPARLLNDAKVQGLGIVAGRGLEVVLTLGMGVGSAVFSDGRLAPHIELAHHPIYKDKTYNDYIGNAAHLAVGTKKWNGRVEKMIGMVQSFLHYDVLYLGGGNAANTSLQND